jgi:hypothetical protein
MTLATTIKILRGAADASRFDVWLDGKPLATDLQGETLEDLCKIDLAELMWALEEHGVVSALAADGDRSSPTSESWTQPVSRLRSRFSSGREGS